MEELPKTYSIAEVAKCRYLNHYINFCRTKITDLSSLKNDILLYYGVINDDGMGDLITAP